MENYGRELFNNNKITEAICQFTFKEHLSSDFCEKLYQVIKTKYSEAENVPKFQLNFSLKNPSLPPVQLSGIKASTSNNEKIIQIFTDNVSVHQIGNYQRWENFKVDIDYILSELQKIINVEIARIDLRVINIFEFEESFKAENYFNIAFKYPKEFLQNSNYQFNLEQIYDPEKEAGVVRGSCISENNNHKFILDLSFINWMLDSNVSISDLETISKSLEKGHMKLYKLFTQSITDKTKQLIK